MALTNPCFFCGGPFHPATGALYGYRTRACRYCVRHFMKWMESHTNKRQSKRSKGVATALSFYEAATNEFSSKKSRGEA